ncbi:hypothetical protein [Mangrovicoccus sp. HB161399]|uniref:hypothetical protein n=1 Tax=Mangrovicoccus sp. HB161399 TaxID=2720392 RepID=UPI001557BBD7|nr:hypothetical protein [Mangrovicoccus sp. HB161399]
MVGHATLLRGTKLPGLADPGAAPVIIGLADQNFVAAFLKRMADADGRRVLADGAGRMRRGADSILRLQQPVHRMFNIAAVEAHCATDGQPRLDPAKILASGLCVRRRIGSGSDATVQGWMTAGEKVLGWRDLPGEATGDPPAWDPDPEMRSTQSRGLNRKVLRQGRRILPAHSGWTEDSAPLFAVPPALAGSIGRTVLYGMVPVTSDARSEDDPAPEAPFSAADVAARLPAMLMADPGGAQLPSAGGGTLYGTSTGAAAEALTAAVSYLAQEPGLFSDEGAAALRDRLSATVLSRPSEQDEEVNEDVTFYDALLEAYELRVTRSRSSMILPYSWPAISEDAEEDIVADILAAMSARWARLSPVEARFEDLSARYEVAAWLRLAGDCGCPPKTIWSAPSEPFEIVPWYEGGDAPPTVVELPRLTDGFYGKLKPNVAFKVPEEIQQFMSGLKLGDLSDGNAPGKKLGFGMICGFSIPILTICAFIVLQIFLVLFHLLFWWLPFIRICIPFPTIEEDDG